MSNYYGEIAALGTSLCWSFCSILFTISSKRIGHNYVNRLRLTIALVFITFVHYIIYKSFVPVNINLNHLFWFGLSGVIGFVIGDRFLFKSFVFVGPRIGMLMMSLTPIFGALIAWIFLHESLTFQKVIATTVTLIGISWVVLERNGNEYEKGHYSTGILLGIGAAFCQALGLILSKKGLSEDLSPLFGNVIRVFVGVVTIWLIPIFKGEIVLSFKKLKDKKAGFALLGGSFLGPFIGVWLSLIAVQYTLVGIASTLMALPPVILLPLSFLIFKEKITIRAIIGTCVTLAGVGMIFLL